MHTIVRESKSDSKRMEMSGVSSTTFASGGGSIALVPFGFGGSIGLATVGFGGSIALAVGFGGSIGLATIGFGGSAAVFEGSPTRSWGALSPNISLTGRTTGLEPSASF